MNITKYRQIDFLRLFRLSRELGAINRKRKMPIDYSTPHESKSAGKRLFRALIKHLFDECVIRTNGDRYFIITPLNVRGALNFVKNMNREYIELLEEEGTQIQNIYAELEQPLNGFIFPVLPYEIKINIISSSGYSVRAMAVSNGATDRPSEEFYRCAKTLIDYKNIWDNNINKIVEFYEKESAMEVERADQIRAVQVERERRRRLTIEDTTITSEDLRNLQNQVREVRNERISNAQSLFDNALAEFRGNDG